MNDHLQPESEAGELVNPYAPPRSDANTKSDRSPLLIPASIAALSCSVSILFWVLTMLSTFPGVGRDAQAMTDWGVGMVLGMVAPGIGLAGAISMLCRKHYWLCMAGAVCLMLPLCGPLLGLTLPIGIWLLVLLQQSSVRDSFQIGRSSIDGADDAENALAAAARLDHRGDWDDAISLYQFIEERWPEHANYVHNCIRDIERKRSARS